MTKIHFYSFHYAIKRDRQYKNLHYLVPTVNILIPFHVGDTFIAGHPGRLSDFTTPETSNSLIINRLILISLKVGSNLLIYNVIIPNSLSVIE